MIRAALAAWFVIAVAVGVAAADPAQDAERAFRDASARGDISALEQLGAQRPLTIWSDNAWSEAARLAVRGNDFDRARRALEQVIAIDADVQLVRRARNELARIASFTGSSGEWTAVAIEHERLVAALQAGGDPVPALEQLARLVRASPRYPRAAMVMVTLARGWEREGDADRALAWLREAAAIATEPADKQRIAAETVRTLIRDGELDEAERELAALSRGGSPGLAVGLRITLERAKLRQKLRWVMWVVLAGLGIAAAIALRRAAGTWWGMLRRLVHPPIEALYLLPIAAILVAFSYTGNPLIARTVLGISIGGIVTSWISGAVLAGQARVRFARAASHAGLSFVAIVASVYLAVDRGHVIDFVIETWHSGFERG